ncbi:hypothetical protein [Lysobacter sp. Root667]|uniref:hypothetical protein n=1 Tax=Lysobacter sp. Root667 TaxID=1736581 RepID=UPI000B130A3C|nr:hypothetical protein [Lysobacter sp. Root667]
MWHQIGNDDALLSQAQLGELGRTNSMPFFAAEILGKSADSRAGPASIRNASPTAAQISMNLPIG